VEQLPNVMIGECLKQEFSTDSWVDIPEGLRDLYVQAGRPRPLFRALSLEKALGTPARLYYKSEFYGPTGSHKVNTALAQAYYAREQGFERLTTETGAGQWGTALAYGCALTGLKCTVYWVRVVYRWSVLNHVLMHQTVIGLETRKQFEKAGVYPDLMISCLGGGSNFGGFVLPFVGDVLTKGMKTKFIAAQSQAAPGSAYSICCAVDEALKCRETGEDKVIAFNVSGHGFMDMEGYREVLGIQ